MITLGVKLADSQDGNFATISSSTLAATLDKRPDSFNINFVNQQNNKTLTTIGFNSLAYKFPFLTQFLH